MGRILEITARIKGIESAALKPLGTWLRTFLVSVAIIFSPALTAHCLPADTIPQEIRLARLVVLGEIHGTKESPLFAGGLACALASSGVPVVLALEIPNSEQPPIEAFILGGSEDSFVEQLRLSPFWSRKFQDGRSSDAMLTLLREIRVLRSQGIAIFVVTIDIAYGQSNSSATRDEVMATNLAVALDSYPNSHFVALMGSMHARRTVGTPFDPGFRPAVHLLSDRPLVSLLMTHEAGEAWVCHGTTVQELSCGPSRRNARHPATGAPSTMHIDSGALPDYDGYYFIGRITASSPAQVSGPK